MALAIPALRGQEKASQMFGDAAAYDRYMGRWSRLLAPQLVRFGDPPDKGRVLDVGSGTGALSFAIVEVKPNCQVVGVDPSKEYVGFAGSRNRYPERVSFEVGDAQQLRFSDDTFDSCISSLVFNFIPDPAKALREVSRVTKPGGSISATVWDYAEGMRMLRVFWDAAKAADPSAEQADELHMRLCRAGELGALWKEGGLERVEERPLAITMQFKAFGDFWEPFLIGQGPAGAYVRKLDTNGREALRLELKRRLQVTEDAPFSLPARAWAVRGVVPMSG